MIQIPNATNGLPLVETPWPFVTYFQSCHGEHKNRGYFDDTAIPIDLILYLLEGRKSIEIIDGTRDGGCPRAFSKGILTFAYTWERARINAIRITKERYMPRCSILGWEHCLSEALEHKKLSKTLRKFGRRISRNQKMPSISLNFDCSGRKFFHPQDKHDNNQIWLSWQRVEYDDNIRRIRKALKHE